MITTLLNPNFWPVNIFVREYSLRKKPETTMLLPILTNKLAYVVTLSVVII